MTTTVCECKVKLRAKGVSAIVHKGYLLGLEAVDPNDRKKYTPVQYEVLEYCQRPTCEKVFRAERKEAD